MTAFLANILFAFLWMALDGAPSGTGFLSGLALGALLLSIVPPRERGIRHGVRLYRIAKLALVFLRELALSVFRVARLVLSPKLDFEPGLIHFPLRLKSDFGITLLANMITLTPGTLTVDVSDDRSHLLVHAIDSPDPEATKHDIAESFERLIMEAFET